MTSNIPKRLQIYTNDLKCTKIKMTSKVCQNDFKYIKMTSNIPK